MSSTSGRAITGNSVVLRFSRLCHRLSACILGAFIFLHLGNHIAGLAGQEVHWAVQIKLRGIYQGWLEPLLLLACLFQIATGLKLAWARRHLKGRALLQPLSGLYMGLFLSIHVSAVLMARASGINTDLAFAAAGLHAGLWIFFFAPYYGLAVLALGLHLSVPVSKHSQVGGLLLIGGSVTLAFLLVLLLSGSIAPLFIPPQLIQVFCDLGC